MELRMLQNMNYFNKLLVIVNTAQPSNNQSMQNNIMNLKSDTFVSCCSVNRGSG